jgi:transposase
MTSMIKKRGRPRKLPVHVEFELIKWIEQAFTEYRPLTFETVTHQLQQQYGETFGFSPNNLSLLMKRIGYASHKTQKCPEA